MTKRISLSLIFLFILISGCSQIQNKVSKKSSSKTLGVSSKKDFEKAYQTLDEKMKLLVAESIKAGPLAVKYLSGDLYLKANDAGLRGDAVTASFLFKHLVDLNPLDLYIKKKYAIELIRSGELASSRPVIELLVKKAKYKDETLSLLLAGVYSALDERNLAKKVYKKILGKKYSSEEACVFLAKSYASESKFKAAHSLLKKCSNKKARAIFSYYRGKIYIRQGNKPKAEKMFERVLRKTPSYYQAVLSKGLILEERGEFKSAIKVYKKFLNRYFESEVVNIFPVLSHAIQVIFASDTEDSNIIAYAEKLTTHDPSDLNLKVRLGILYTDKKRFNDAKIVFNDILNVVPDSDKVLYYLGALYQQTSHYDNSIEYFSKIPEDSTLFHDGHIQIAQMLQIVANKQHLEGEGSGVVRFKKFISDSSQKHVGMRVDLKVMLGTFLESIGDFKGAVEAVESIKNEKNYNENHDYYLASLYEKDKNVVAARKLILKILEKNPNNAHALNFMGYSFLENAVDYDKAYEYIKKAVALKPKDGYIRDSLGWYYYKVGELDNALREIKLAWSLSKKDVVITKHLAIVYQAMRKYTKAKEFYIKALKNCKLESERGEVLQALDHLENLRLPASEKK